MSAADRRRRRRGKPRRDDSASTRGRHRTEALGVGLIALGLLISLAVLPPLLGLVAGEGNLIGPAGDVLHVILAGLFGVFGALLAFPAFIWGARCLGLVEGRTATRWMVLLGGVLLLAPAGWWLIAGSGESGVAGAGWLGLATGRFLAATFGVLGARLIVAAGLVGIAVLTLGWSPARGAGRVGRGVWWGLRATAAGLVRLASRLTAAARSWRERSARTEAVARGASLWAGSAEEEADEGVANELDSETPATEERPDGTDGGVRELAPGLGATESVSAAVLPPLDLLARHGRSGSGLAAEELHRLGQTVVNKLGTFRVEGSIGGWTTGPVVTQFEVIPAEGVKVGQIAALADDLALALKAPSVRIVAPIPGKGAVGVEVPNPEPAIVHLREILESREYRRTDALLPLALGRDLDGTPYCADLARMPHLLIAGATGSGKSVCINTIVTSLIFRYTPPELRLLMIDPKMVELVVYNDLPHLRHPVVTDNHDAAAVLRWAVHEMNRRYGLLSTNACRNVVELNRRIESGDPVEWPRERGGGMYEDGPLPFIVLVIDELADLIMTVQSEIETPLTVLAQKARAVGMHLVVATQRPSVNVITGLIKANFPCRIAFRVASKTDSRTILDQNGAESLLGNGDMLFLPPGESDPHRIQGGFVTTGETERLVAWYREVARRRDAQGAVESDILEDVRELELEEGQLDVDEQILAEWDPYFRTAAEIVINNNSGSTSLLQRRLKIGYGRAARIIDQLHTAGVLGPPDGPRPREILITHEQLDALMRGERPPDA